MCWLMRDVEMAVNNKPIEQQTANQHFDTLPLELKITVPFAHPPGQRFTRPDTR
jgi:hypothetical protein